MEQHIRQAILAAAPELFGAPISESLIQFQITRKDVEGDLTLVVFPFVKLLRCSPQEAGEKLKTWIEANVPGVSHCIVINGFLNIVLTDAYWLAQLSQIQMSPNYGLAPQNSKPTVMVEYASPNTNKPLHLGHLRNIFLGASVAEILHAVGHKVVRTQVINDRGIHICKSMLAWEKFSPVNARGERETPANTGLKGDKLVGKYYVEFDKALQKEAKEIMAQWQSGNFSDTPEAIHHAVLNFEQAKQGKDEKACAAIDDKIKELAKNQTQILQEAKQMLVKWEARDPQVYLLWTTMNGWVYAGFDQTYAQMGVSFDKLYYESDTFLLGKDQVMEGLKNGVFYQKTDGSVWIDLTAEGLDEKLVLRSDGTAVYMTQDIGTAIDRFKDFPDLHGMVYTVGNEQDYHFKVLFLILQKLGYAWADNCFHLSYGMVDLPSGKMKSREGTVVDADDLMAEVIEKAKAMTQERGHLDGLNEVERDTLYAQIGLGGLKYYLLKVDPKKRMLFNPEESIDLTGNTGPFLQYAHARISTLLDKANYQPAPIAERVVLRPEEKEIVKQLAQFEVTLQEAAKGYSPALLANYTYELVKLYNTFYQSVKIVIEPDLEVRHLRLALSAAVKQVLAQSLSLLGVEAPSRM
ncbi:MAG: arginine--tRNA ligase [Cryomorphaceae bacterium]|jgi:arginyl-tRNA synthetase|nr:arginine--tRNA ligase [Cryomorphaceae bacterium]